jgi:hypothetical protein
VKTLVRQGTIVTALDFMEQRQPGALFVIAYRDVARDRLLAGPAFEVPNDVDVAFEALEHRSVGAR